MKGLLEAMRSSGITIEDVAAVVGHRPATVARWMDGEGRGFTLQAMCDIRDALFPACSLEELARTGNNAF